MAMAGKFCSTSNCDSATQRWTDFTNITTCRTTAELPSRTWNMHLKYFWPTLSYWAKWVAEKDEQTHRSEKSCTDKPQWNRSKRGQVWSTIFACVPHLQAALKTETVLNSPGWTPARRAGRRVCGSSRCPSVCSNTAADREESASSHRPQTPPSAENRQQTSDRILYTLQSKGHCTLQSEIPSLKR